MKSETKNARHLYEETHEYRGFPRCRGLRARARRADRRAARRSCRADLTPLQAPCFREIY